MTEGAREGHSSIKPQLAPRVQRRRRMEALGVKQEKSPGVFPNRQIEREFNKLTMKDQAVLLMSRRKLLGWLAVISTGAGGLGRRFGPGALSRLGQVFTKFRLNQIARAIDKLEKRTGDLSVKITRAQGNYLKAVEKLTDRAGSVVRGRLTDTYFRAIDSARFVRMRDTVNNLQKTNFRLGATRENLIQKWFDISNRTGVNKPGGPWGD